MHSRHLNMIAIGGAIGTGLFVASGNTIATAEPGGALLAYALIGFMVYLLMQSLGELATYMPVAGSFHEYGSRFISSSFEFAIRWNYWFNWVITVAAGEAKDPNRSIPKAINAIFWRILLFYIFVIFIISTLLPFTDPNLLKLEPILALIMCIIVIIGQNYEALIQGRDFVTLLTSYIGLWLFLLIWAGHKLITKSKAIDPLQVDIKHYNY